MKRALFATAAVAIVMSATPAAAQTAPRAAVTAPADGAVVTGVTTVRGTGSATVGVRTLQLYIADVLVATREPKDLRQNAEVDYSWDSTRIPGSSQMTANDWYEIRVRVVANDGAEATDTRSVRVDNGVSAPTGLAVNISGQTATLTWNPNPEPDITGYRVEIDEGGGFETLDTTQATEYSYATAPGTYSWRVVAFRSSPNDPAGKVSAPSGAVSAGIVARSESGGAASGRKKAGDKKIFGGSNKAARAYVRETRRRFASMGISSAGISLPGISLGLPRLPDGELKWGTFKGKLPYGTPEQQGSPLVAEPVRLAARSTSSVMPLDALQWLAAGILMVVIAGLLQFLAQLAVKEEKNPA